MSEDEIMSTDLYTIYELIEVHAKINGVKKSSKGSKKERDDREVYIDTLIF